MKHKCVINHCGRRGIWVGHYAQVYCDRHYTLALEESGRSHSYPFASDRRYLGRVHEGRKRGKPYVWKEFFHA